MLSQHARRITQRAHAFTRRALSNRAPDALKHALRSLLRETAQPVAVVTALMPAAHRTADDVAEHTRFHGATLSSFTSIALDPHPLVAFSLRVPSRMASALSAPFLSPPSSSPADTNAHPSTHAHMVINILSASQAALAVRFSRPDLHAHPFADVPYTLSAAGLPVLSGALGALSCAVVGPPWPLHDVHALARGERPAQDAGAGGDGAVDGMPSELFIARVVGVEDAGAEGQTPLLYHRRAYATTGAIPAPVVPPKSQS